MRWLMTLVLVVCFQGIAAPARAWEEWPGESSRDRVSQSRHQIETAVFRLEVPFRTQKDGGRWQISNCGPATLGMVLDAFGIAGQATDDLRYRSHTYQGTWGMRTGTALQHIAQVANDFGVPTIGLYNGAGQFNSWSEDDIRQQLRSGRPVMALVRLYLLPSHASVGSRWGHYILLTGTTEDGFFYSDSLQTDPSTGVGQRISAEQLERAMQASHIPGQAVAFGGPPLPPLAIWVPGGVN